jgi:hypothetical protein
MTKVTYPGDIYHVLGRNGEDEGEVARQAVSAWMGLTAVGLPV